MTRGSRPGRDAEPLVALESVTSMAMSDARVAVCGDWHGNVGWVRMLTRAITALTPDVSTILQLGDWWMDPTLSDEVFGASGIERVLVTLGNHEPWGEITRLQRAHPGMAIRVSQRTWLLPRPARLRIGDRDVLSLGGAASLDRSSRREGHNWWPQEAIADAHITAAVAGGHADVMLTHESPARTPVQAVREILRTNPHRFPASALSESRMSRERIAQVWHATAPALLIHGHMHTPGIGTTSDGRRVASLGRDGQEGHLGILDTRTLTIQFPTLREMRDAALKH